MVNLNFNRLVRMKLNFKVKCNKPEFSKVNLYKPEFQG
jgi:hypothetical protein